MFLEKMFGNTFGLLWLAIFSLSILALVVWLFIKKDKVVKNDLVSNNREEKVEEKIEVAAPIVEQTKEPIKEEKKSNYEIIEIDGFFKVRKVGSERTIRKFATNEEALSYVKEKENDWSKINR